MKRDGFSLLPHSEPSWSAVPEDLAMAQDEVHVWRASLEMTPFQVKTLVQILSADELDRAGRFHFLKDRDHFIAARGVLRIILGKYLKKEPKELQFCCGPNGKPALTGKTGKKFRFNISHSHGLCIFGVALNRDIGVDIEYIRSDLSDVNLAEQFLSPHELLIFSALPDDDRPRVFFSWWTRKEAYLKARGLGLSVDLKRLEVVHALEHPAEFDEMRGATQEETSWSFMDLAVMPNYAAALAVEGYHIKFNCWQWEHAWLSG